MAPDRVPPRTHLGSLSPDAAAALHDALEHYVGNGGDEGTLRAALRLVTAEARAKDIPPEQLMIAFKSLWEELPSVRATSDPRLRSRLLERLITASIQEYFAG